MTYGARVRERSSFHSRFPNFYIISDVCAQCKSPHVWSVDFVFLLLLLIGSVHLISSSAWLLGFFHMPCDCNIHFSTSRPPPLGLHQPFVRWTCCKHIGLLAGDDCVLLIIILIIIIWQPPFCSTIREVGWTFISHNNNMAAALLFDYQRSRVNIHIALQEKQMHVFKYIIIVIYMSESNMYYCQRDSN